MATTQTTQTLDPWLVPTTDSQRELWTFAVQAICGPPEYGTLSAWLTVRSHDDQWLDIINWDRRDDPRIRHQITKLIGAKLLVRRSPSVSFAAVRYDDVRTTVVDNAADNMRTCEYVRCPPATSDKIRFDGPYGGFSSSPHTAGAPFLRDGGAWFRLVRREAGLA
jgi:hypothetical protein